jgi:hypothetical protein
MLQSLEKFAYATSLDLNMGYYTIGIHHFGKYQYLRLPNELNLDYCF